MRVRQNLTWGMRVMGVAVLLLLLGASRAAAQTAALSDLVVASLSPGFSPAVKTYSIPRTSACVVPVAATLANPAHRLYISNMETPSGTVRSAWVCDGRTKIDIVIYSGWTEVGRYTVNVVAGAPAPPPPAAATLSSLVIANLSPAFDPSVKAYTIPRTTACSVPVTATLTTATHKLQIQNGDTPSGTTRLAWVCDGRTKIDVVIYQVWTEVGRYTITLVGEPPAPGPPPPPPPPPLPPTEPTLVLSPAPVFSDPLPSVSPTTAAVAQRLLHQATFGPSPADMADVQAKGVDYWLTEQFQKPASAIPDGLDINALRAHLFTNMATGNDQLRQRVMFALSQILVISANKNVNGNEIIPWLRLLSRHAFGNYRSLLRDLTVSPAMGKFLDLANSVGGQANISANENYPRELLQLFSVGIWKLNNDGTLFLDGSNNPVPAYTPATLSAVSRALSGWTYPTAPGAPYRARNNEYMVGLMEARPASHDRGAKTIFGTTLPANQTVTADMESVIDIVFAHENVPPFVATRLIRSLVTSNPTAEYIERVANVFIDNGQGVRGDLRAVITAILTDPDADMPSATDGRLLDPVLNVIGFGRALDAQFGDANQFQYILGNLGQHLLTPASVFSFYSPLAPLPGGQGLFGPEFMIYPPALAIHRANFIYGILTNQLGSSIRVDLAPFVALAGNPQALVSLVDQKLLQGRMSPDLRAVLVTSVNAVSDPTQRAIGALYLAAISSEFLVHAGY
jgi:uncharacterized protein (DUF1800 family)